MTSSNIISSCRFCFFISSKSANNFSSRYLWCPYDLQCLAFVLNWQVLPHSHMYFFDLRVALYTFMYCVIGCSQLRPQRHWRTLRSSSQRPAPQWAGGPAIVFWETLPGVASSLALSLLARNPRVRRRTKAFLLSRGPAPFTSSALSL